LSIKTLIKRVVLIRQDKGVTTTKNYSVFIHLYSNKFICKRLLLDIYFNLDYINQDIIKG